MRLARNSAVNDTIWRVVSLILVIVAVIVGLNIAIAVLSSVELGQLSTKFHKLKSLENKFEEFSIELISNVTLIDQEVEVCCELENTVISNLQKRECVSSGILEEATGCSYSSNEILETKERISHLWARHISPALIFYNSNLDWSRFESGVQEFHYATTFVEKNNYPALEDTIDLLLMIDSAVALSSTTDLERAGLKVVRQEVKFNKDLLELNFPHSQYAGGWNIHAVGDDFLLWQVLPFFDAEPDYDTKVLLYMQRLYVSKNASVIFYQDALVKDSPPQVEQAASCAEWSGIVTLMATPTIRDILCDKMDDVLLQSQCYILSAMIDVESAALDVIYNGAYCAAALALRPPTQPGLSNVHFGNETYYAWLRYMSGMDTSILARNTFAQQMIDEGSLAIDTLMNEVYPGSGLAQWISEQSDFNNPRFISCFDTLEEVTRHFEAADSNVSRAIGVEFQYHSRSHYKIDPGESCCSYSSGDYNPNTNLWSSEGTFFYGPKGLNNASQLCVDRFVHSLVMHEGRTGHHLEFPLRIQRKCNLDDEWTFFSGYHEGWSAYTELQCNQTTLCDDPNERMFNLYWTTLGTGAVLKADIALNSFSQTYAQCLAINNAAGGGVLSDKFCTRSAALPGQLAGYSMGSQFIAAQRLRAETELGSSFSAPEFNMLVSKFSEMTWDELDLMVTAYIKWVQDRPASLSMKWGSTIDKVLYKSADPVVGTGFVVPNTGAVLINSVLTEAQTNALAYINSHPLVYNMLNKVQLKRAAGLRS